MILMPVDSWHGCTKRHPVLVMLILTLLFTLAVLMWDALDSVVYYNDNETMPAALGWTISALYLGATFVIGLVTPLRVGGRKPGVGLSRHDVAVAPPVQRGLR